MRGSLVRVNKSAKHRERNVCRFEAAAWGRGALRDSGPSGCEGDYLTAERPHQIEGAVYQILKTQVVVTYKKWPFLRASDHKEIIQQKKMQHCDYGQLVRAHDSLFMRCDFQEQGKRTHQCIDLLPPYLSPNYTELRPNKGVLPVIPLTNVWMHNSVQNRPFKQQYKRARLFGKPVDTDQP